MTSNMMGPKTKTTQECMTKDKFNPEKMSKDMLDGMPGAECDSSNDVSGDVMTMDLTCNMQGGTMTAKGNWEFNGDEGSGNMKMDVEMQGMKMSMEVESQGRRIGDC